MDDLGRLVDYTDAGHEIRIVEVDTPLTRLLQRLAEPGELPPFEMIQVVRRCPDLEEDPD